ncbi:MAG: DedA family protein [Dehalococcoidia bacterium]|jgi:membrane protein DedA with SNARE-associated domain
MTLYIFEFIKQLISTLGYPGIFITMTLESMLMPIPSEAVMPFVGFLAYEGKMEIWIAVLVSSLANLAGSLIAYAVGRYLGRGFILKYGKYILLNIHHLELTEQWFLKYGSIAVLFSRMLPVVRSIIALPAGIGKMNIWRFCLFTFIGSVPWNLGLIYAGYLLKENWGMLERYTVYIDIIAITAIVAVLVYLGTRILAGARQR